MVVVVVVAVVYFCVSSFLGCFIVTMFLIFREVGFFWTAFDALFLAIGLVSVVATAVVVYDVVLLKYFQPILFPQCFNILMVSQFFAVVFCNSCFFLIIHNAFCGGT